MPYARKTDPTTSHEAAAKVDNLTATKQAILKALNHPRTDVDLISAYQSLYGAPAASESGIRTRRAELVAAGLVLDSGLRAKLPSGRRAIIWAKA
jgi:hypothetical protein